MKLDAVKEIAKAHGIKAGRLRKAELIQAIQQAEGNRPCFNTEQSSLCGQTTCCWREDCI